jgi:hypothetical protein
MNASFQNREVLAYDKMDQLSQEFARALFLEFPNWERLAEDVEDEKTGAHCIEVNVPQEGANRQLHLSTTGNEITIAFDHWHTHIGPFLGLSTAESVDEAIVIIVDFVNEHTVVKVSRRDGVWIESGLEYLVAPCKPTPHSTTEVFSWRGTYDQTVETP